MKPPADHFAAVPAAWEEWQQDFNTTARAVYVQLLFSMHRQTGTVRLSLRALAERAGLSRGQVDRALRSLASGGVISYAPGTNQHSETTIEVLLRRGAVLPMRRRAVTPAGHQQDSASHQQDSASHQQDSASHQQDSSRTAHHLSPAETPGRGLEVYPDEEEEGAGSPSDLLASESSDARKERRTKSGRICPACRGTRVCNEGDGTGDYTCGACRDGDYE
jgi:hypothetical protein